MRPVNSINLGVMRRYARDWKRTFLYVPDTSCKSKTIVLKALDTDPPIPYKNFVQMRRRQDIRILPVPLDLSTPSYTASQ